MSPITPLQAVGFAKEVTPGTFVAPNKFLPCNSAGPTTNPRIARPDQMRGSRDQIVDAVLGYESGFNVTADLVPAPIGDLVAGAFGIGSDVVSGSAGTGYLHTLTPKNDLPSYSFEVSHDEHTKLLSRQITGCMVDQFTIACQAQALASFEAQMIGIKEQTPATPGNPSWATPLFPVIQPFDFSITATTYGGAGDSNVTDFNLGFQNAVQRVFTGNQSQYVRRLVATKRMITLSAGFDFVNLLQYNDWKNAVYINGFTIDMIGRENPPGASNPWRIAFTIARLRADGQFDLQSANDVLQAKLTFSTTLGVAANIISGEFRTGDSAAYA